MRYRRLTYRYAMVVRAGRVAPFSELWPGDRLRLVVQTHWQPATDTYETATTIEVVVDLAGVEEDAVEILLFEDALIVEGDRRLPAGDEDAVYHAASIRQGPFRVVLPLPASVDAERVETHYDRGLLYITLPKLA
jgi:HSP20 family protein